MFYIMLSILCCAAHSQVSEVVDVIRDPTITRRCKALISARNQKVQNFQKLNSLLKRTTKLEKKVKPNQVTAIQKINLSKAEIEKSIRLSKLKIQTMEENIVRRGCPGISL